MNRVIIHVDLNSFFATAEQQANPALRAKPVGIIKARGRGCIIAASVEAKKRGVGTGANVYDAKKLCPEIILIPADFDKYADISFRFIDICKSYSPVCEVFSLDECFIDVSQTERFWKDLPKDTGLDQTAMFDLWTIIKGTEGRGAVNIAFEIKKRLREEIGDYMTCSVGISENKLLAKLAGNQIKPDGLFWITDENKLAVLDKSGLLDVCGLGFGLHHHLIRLGIDNFPKLRACSLTFLKDHFGPFWSFVLYNIARGIDNTAVTPYFEIPDAKSVGRTYTTHKNLINKTEIKKLIRNLCEEAAAKARVMGLAGRYVGLALREGDLRTKSSGWSARGSGGGFYGHLTLQHYIDDGRKFFDLCMQISRDWQIDNVRFAGVTLGMLAKKEYLTTPLFSADRRREKVVKTVDKVNNKYGNYTVFPAQLLGMPIIMPEVNGFFGEKKYRLNFLRH